MGTNVSVQKEERLWKPTKMDGLSLKIQKALIDQVLIWSKGIGYGFNSEGIFVNLCKIDIKSETTQVNTEFIANATATASMRCGYYTAIDCVKKLRVGNTMEVFNNYIVAAKGVWQKKLAKKDERSELERFITKIGKPIFERLPGNDVPNTFDLIHIDVGTASNWEEDKLEYATKNRKKITRMVKEKLKKNKVFKNMGASVNDICVKSLILSYDGLLKYVFEKRA